MPGIKIGKNNYVSYSRKNSNFSCFCGYQTDKYHLFKLHGKGHGISIKKENEIHTFIACGTCGKRNCRGH